MCWCIQQASTSADGVLIHRTQSYTSIQFTEEDIRNNQVQHNRADGFNQKNRLRRIFYAMMLVSEIASAVLGYQSSRRQPQHALFSMILSITSFAISLIQLAYTGGKEKVTWQRRGWILGFIIHLQLTSLLDILSTSLVCFSPCFNVLNYAIAAYHYLFHQQDNPSQFSVYSIILAFCLLWSKF